MERAVFLSVSNMQNLETKVFVMVWYGMVNVDLYSAIITKVSALNTLVSGEKPGFQTLSKGLESCCVRRSSGTEFQTMGPCTANARRPAVVSRCRGTTISCCVADLRRCNQGNQGWYPITISDGCGGDWTKPRNHRYGGFFELN